MNKVFILGNLGRDPELRYTQSQTAVCNFQVATKEKYTDDNGQKVEKTEWHNIVAWNKVADICSKYLKKGSAVLVEGKLQSKPFTDKQGEQRTKIEIVANNVQLIGSREDRESNYEDRPHQKQPVAQRLSQPLSSMPPLSDMDDIPF